MDRNIEIEFRNNNIKKYIKNSEELVIKNETFKIITYDEKCTFKICIDSQKKIYTLNKLFYFFIKHKCFFYEPDLLLFNIDKDLFYKSGYWFLNYEEYWRSFPDETLHYLTLTHNDKVIKFIENIFYCVHIQIIFIIMDLDLGSVDFLVSKCKSELSKENYGKFTEKLINCAKRYMGHLISNYGITFFRCMCKNNILVLLLDYLRIKKRIDEIIYLSVKTNQTEIIDYLLQYGLDKKEVRLDGYEHELLIYLIKKDNEETFLYVVQNINISNKLIQTMIEGSGDFITKEYIEILLNNGKLNLKNLKLLKKSIKNNPDKKLKKYIKKLILEEKIEIKNK